MDRGPGSPAPKRVDAKSRTRIWHLEGAARAFSKCHHEAVDQSIASDTPWYAEVYCKVLMGAGQSMRVLQAGEVGVASGDESRSLFLSQISLPTSNGTDNRLCVTHALSSPSLASH